MLANPPYNDADWLRKDDDLRRQFGVPPIEGDLVESMVALPGQIFDSTRIQVCLWGLAEAKDAGAKRGLGTRSILAHFNNAGKLGTLIGSVHTPFVRSAEEILRFPFHCHSNGNIGRC